MIIVKSNLQEYPINVLNSSSTLNWELLKKEILLKSFNWKNKKEEDLYKMMAPIIQQISLQLFNKMRKMTADSFHKKFENYYDILPNPKIFKS